jgi:hypothetical protein
MQALAVCELLHLIEELGIGAPLYRPDRQLLPGCGMHGWCAGVRALVACATDGCDVENLTVAPRGTYADAASSCLISWNFI